MRRAQRLGQVGGQLMLQERFRERPGLGQTGAKQPLIDIDGVDPCGGIGCCEQGGQEDGAGEFRVGIIR